MININIECTIIINYLKKDITLKVVEMSKTQKLFSFVRTAMISEN
jgi:hypothetical protein